MFRRRSIVQVGAVLLLGSTLPACAPRQTIPLYTLPTLKDSGGEQRVWPHFADRPMVIAFWSVDSIEAIEDLPALNTLARRYGPIDLVSVCVSEDLVRVERWIRKQEVSFEVIHDPDERLARRLGVTSYPTYVFLDKRGREIDRRLRVHTVHNWFDRPRWIRRADPDLYPDGLPPETETQDAALVPATAEAGE